MLKKSNSLNFQVEHDGRHHPVQNSKPCRKLRLVMLDWPGAPTWHFARSILNASPGHSKSRSLGPDFEIDGSGGIGARPRLGGGAELLARSPWSRSTCATCAGLTAWVAWGALVANETSGRPERVDPQASHGKGGGLWQCYRASESALPMRI